MFEFLNIFILFLIAIYAIAHNHLSVFYQMDTELGTNHLPYRHGFLLWNFIFHFFALAGLIWMFGFIIGGLIFLLVLFQIPFLTYLWVFLYPFYFLLGGKGFMNEKGMYTAYTIYIGAVPLVVILTIANFFISDYSEFLQYIKNYFGENLNHFLFYLTITGLILGILRILFHKVKEKLDAAHDLNTPPDMLHKLARSRMPGVRTLIALNPNTPEDTLRTLAKSKHGIVRGNVALNKNTPEDALTALATDEDWRVRENVAIDKHTPRVLVNTLLNEEVSQLNEVSIQNKSIPKKILRVLAKDKDDVVRFTIASNKNAPKDVLQILEKDKDKAVREAAKENL